MLSTESRDQNFFDMAIEKIRTIVIEMRILSNFGMQRFI